MLGFFSGVLLTVWFRNQGPQKPVYEWMEEEEKETETGGSGDEEIGRVQEGEKGRGGDLETKGLRDETLIL
jgi:hypothetical protein